MLLFLDNVYVLQQQMLDLYHCHPLWGVPCSNIFNGKTVAILWNVSQCFGEDITNRAQTLLYNCHIVMYIGTPIFFPLTREATQLQKNISQFNFLRWFQNRDIFIGIRHKFCDETWEGLRGKRFAHKLKPSSCPE